MGKSTRAARLVPFHFSARQADDPQRLLEEVQAACPQTVVPGQFQTGGRASTPD